MKKGAFLINAARGGLVDEETLAARLVAGELAGAALDAFCSEPLQQNSAIRTAPNVILTPHIGAFTHHANAAMGVTVVSDIARVLRNEEPVNPVFRSRMMALMARPRTLTPTGESFLVPGRRL